ncbi:hypothetical protein [Pikeienuella sp. HZG-20]|uniref:hypothetical protein n=1 Tax=Paludibacillus litoralis TaxID=3133267 RepID=UPI0030EE9A80
MTQTRKLDLSLGAFRCEIVGYDDPHAILGRVVELFSETASAEAWMAASGGPRGADLRARFAEKLREEAARLDAEVAAGPDEVRVARRDAEPGLDDAGRPRLAATEVIKMPPGMGPELERMRARFAREEAERPLPKPAGEERSLFDDDHEPPKEEETLILSRADRAPSSKRGE